MITVATGLGTSDLRLLSIRDYYDVALRDLGLVREVVALQRLSTRYGPWTILWPLWDGGR